MGTALKEEEKHDYPNTEREGKTGNERDSLNTAQIKMPTAVRLEFTVVGFSHLNVYS